MVARGLGKLAARLVEVSRPAAVRQRAFEFGQRLKSEYEAGRSGEPELDDAAVADIASRLRTVDWASVKAATAAKGSEAADAARTMASRVDWAKVQPVAAQVSTALIAAVASGQIPLAGTGGRVARAILNDQGFADRIGATLADQEASPPDLRPMVIDTTATEVPDR